MLLLWRILKMKVSHHVLCVVLHCVMYIPYSGKLSREKTFANFVVLWLYAKLFSAKFGAWRPLALQKQAIRKSFLRENCIFTNSRKFAPSKVSRYTVCYYLSSPLLPPMHTNKQHTHLSIHTVINALITAPEIPEGLPCLHLECTTNSN